MALCSGIKADGGRCKAQAIRGSAYCIGHDPDQADARRRRASKGGKRGGRGRPVAELGALRDENADIRRRLLEGELVPGVAAVAIQSLNCDIRAVATTLKAREQEEFQARLEALEEALEQRKGDRRYGA
jgi:predicted acylesterase/phospholipase RssA